MAATVHAFAPRPSTDVRSPLQSGAVAAFPAWRTQLKGYVHEEAVNLGPSLLVLRHTARAALLYHPAFDCSVWVPKASVRREAQSGNWWLMRWIAKRFHPLQEGRR